MGESEVTKKQKIAKESPESADGKKEDSIEAIQEFIKNTDTVMEVDAAPPNQEALEKRRAKRPYQCPVCGWFFSNTWPRFTSGISFWHFPRRSIQFTPVRCFNAQSFRVSMFIKCQLWSVDTWLQNIRLSSEW